MAPLPTIGNCVRVSCNWNTVNGITPRNIFHVITSSEDEEEIALAVQTALHASAQKPFGCMLASRSIASYTVTLMDGHSAGQVVASTFAISGEQTGEEIPASAAVLSLHSPQRGPRGRGRLYIGPIGEAAQANGLVGSGNVSGMLSAWSAFETSLAASSISGSLGVASYVHSEVNGVTSLSMRPQCGTQRRRQNQLV